MISVAHSPDSDDFFMFWAIVNDRINLDGLSFCFQHHDTRKLNSIAKAGEHDVVAISTAAYIDVAADYSILTSGASVGRGYGPVVVAKKEIPIGDLNDLKIAVPGKSTTAALVLSKIAPQAETIEIPIEPFDLVFSALDKGDVDAALLIHEGQISYRERDLFCIVDIGQWWNREKGLPLPLGINIVKKDLGGDIVPKVANVLSRSIRYGLDHQEEILEALVALNISRKADLVSREGVQEYLERFANEDTFCMDDSCKQAVRELLGPDVDISFA